MQLNSPDEFADSHQSVNPTIVDSIIPKKQKIRFSILRVLAVLGFLSLPGIVVILIASPSILSGGCAQKAKQSEARTYVGSILRSQEANFLETQHFSSSIEALNIGIKAETTNFKYLVSSTPQATFSYGISQKGNLRSIVGAVFIFPAHQAINSAYTQEKSTVLIMCETQKTGDKNPAQPSYQNGKLSCGQGTRELVK